MKTKHKEKAWSLAGEYERQQTIVEVCLREQKTFPRHSGTISLLKRREASKHQHNGSQHFSMPLTFQHFTLHCTTLASVPCLVIPSYDLPPTHKRRQFNESFSFRERPWNWRAVKSETKETFHRREMMMEHKSAADVALLCFDYYITVARILCVSPSKQRSCSMSSDWIVFGLFKQQRPFANCFSMRRLYCERENFSSVKFKTLYELLRGKKVFFLFPFKSILPAIVSDAQNFFSFSRSLTRLCMSMSKTPVNVLCQFRSHNVVWIVLGF